MKKILVIEYSKECRSFICQFLRMEKFQVIEAENGCIGLQLINEHHPDLVLSDLNMPKLNGYGVLKELRSNLATAQIPLIFLTGNTNSDERELAWKMGANAYLTKPVKFDALLEAIFTHLNPSKLGSS